MSGSTPFYDAWQTAWTNKDLDGMLALVTDDFVFEWHSSGKIMDKAGWKAMMEGFIKANMPPAQKERCIYENGDICISHNFVKFPNGSVDAVMMTQMLRDGKCYRVETGSTPVPEESPNFIKSRAAETDQAARSPRVWSS